MPAGKQTRCRACNSADRPDIDRLLLEGQSSHKVAKWLIKDGREQIPQPALAMHKRKHLDVRTDASERVAQQVAAVFEAAVQRVIADVNLLDELAGYALDAVRRLSSAIGDPTMPQAAAYGAALKEGRELVRAREEILKGRGGATEPSGQLRPAVNIIYAAGVTAPDADPPQPSPEPGSPATPAR